MTRAQVIILQLTTAIVTATGVVFAWMKYFVKTDDPFAVANHPWQPHVLAIHVVAAPLMAFALGWIFQNHILAKIAANGNARQRLSGIVATILLLPMILSGYLMQVITSEALQWAMVIAHWISSGLFVIVYVAHLLGKKNGKTNNR